MNILHRRHRLPRPYYLGWHNYFLTICTADRRKLLTDPALVGALVELMAEQFSRVKFSVFAYCFMPDHCHILVVSQAKTCNLAGAIRAFKGASAARARQLGVRNLWQRDYYDHILRSGESLHATAAYIFANPVRARLAKDPHSWPFSGSFLFDWKAMPDVTEDFVPPWKQSV
jgi:putative transposase